MRISAKSLGAVALPSFCPRCFWIHLRVPALPFQIFPGIFSSIDSYGKRLVQAWFERHEGPPPWLAPLGDIKKLLPAPHYSKFNVRDPETAILLTGAPDAVLEERNGSHIIIDYKTARYTEYQDELFPVYEVQLNAYAYIGERCGLAPVSSLALVYTEPVTGDSAARDVANASVDGFNLKFSARILPVSLQPESIPRWLRKVREIYDLARPPARTAGCQDCSRLDDLLRAAAR
jgi:hypothetical protein